MIKLLEYEDTLPPLSSSDNEEHETLRNERKSGKLVACVVVEWLRLVTLLTSTLLAGMGFYNMGKQSQQGSLEIGLFVGVFLSFVVSAIVLFVGKRKILFLPSLIGTLVVAVFLHTDGVLSVSIQWSMAFPVFLIILLSLLGASGFVFSALFFNQFYNYEIVGEETKVRFKNSLLKAGLTFIRPESLIYFFFMVSTSIGIILLDGHSFSANLLAFFHTEHEDKNLEDDNIFKSLSKQLTNFETKIELEKDNLRIQKNAIYRGKKRKSEIAITNLGLQRPIRLDDKQELRNQIANLKTQIVQDSITSITETMTGEKDIDAKYDVQLNQLLNAINERTAQINDGNINGQIKSDESKKNIEDAGYGFAKFNEPLFLFLTFVSLHFRRRLGFRLVSKMKVNQGNIIGRMFYTLKLAFRNHLQTFIQEWDRLLLGDETAAKLEKVNITSMDITPSVSEAINTDSIRIWSKEDAERYFRTKVLKVFERGYKSLDEIAEHKRGTRIQSNKNNRTRFNQLLTEMEENTGWTIVFDETDTELSMMDNGENWQRPVFHLKVKKMAAIA